MNFMFLLIPPTHPTHQNHTKINSMSSPEFSTGELTKFRSLSLFYFAASSSPPPTPPVYDTSLPMCIEKSTWGEHAHDCSQTHFICVVFDWFMLLSPDGYLPTFVFIICAWKPQLKQHFIQHCLLMRLSTSAAALGVTAYSSHDALGRLLGKEGCKITKTQEAPDKKTRPMPDAVRWL